MKIIRTTSVLTIALALLVSCNSGNDKKSASSASTSNLSEVIKATDAISPEITNVEDVFKTLELVDAAYYPILCNDPYNATSYLNSKPVASANLGVYITDIVYHLYGDASSEMFITFSATQELAKYIGLEDEFAVTLLTELEGGGEVSRDSLIFIFNGLMKDSEKYSSENEMAYVHTSFLTGLYIEKLFITSSLLDQAYKKEAKSEEDITNAKKLLAIFQNQLKSVDVLAASLNGQYENLGGLIQSEDVKALKASSAALTTKFNELIEAEGLETCEHVIDLHTQLSSMRNRIVSAS